MGRVLNLAKKILKCTPFVGECPSPHPGFMDIISIELDEYFVRSLLNAILNQVDEIKYLGLTAEFICMGITEYEQAVAHAFDLDQPIDVTHLLGLRVIVSPSFENRVEVQCSAANEMMYRKELNKIRRWRLHDKN